MIDHCRTDVDHNEYIAVPARFSMDIIAVGAQQAS
jgi:hypothetical protein